MPRHKTKSKNKRQVKQKRQGLNNVITQVKKIEKEWQPFLNEQAKSVS